MQHVEDINYHYKPADGALASLKTADELRYFGKMMQLDSSAHICISFTSNIQSIVLITVTA